jgi:ATPase family protein associated with various cellular activities (AAA)
MDDEADFHRVGDALIANARDLERELDWFTNVLEARLKAYFDRAAVEKQRFYLPAPPLDGTSPYGSFIRQHQVDPRVRLIILLALIPHVRPQLLDVLWTRNESTQRSFSEFGGVHASQGGFLPTGETAAFLLAGDDLAARFDTMRLFDAGEFLARHNVVHVGHVSSGEPQLAGLLTISREFLHRFTSGLDRKPGFNAEFPARLIRTELEWDDLVLPPSTLADLDEIRAWVRHGPTLLGEWGLGAKLRPGFTSLFHGPPGTGKTLSARLLGKHCGCDVYKVDLSLIVSKYIGETEKNLARIFDVAEHKGWILFFDEADALFGKRTRVEDSHDRYANQEISFLLQRIEEFDGVAILASNFRANIDDAFLRRFQSVVHFPMPKPPERLRMWREAFPRHATLDARIDLCRIAEQYDLSGGTIMNVVRYASLMAVSRGGGTIALDDVEEGVRREFLKEGRAL